MRLPVIASLRMLKSIPSRILMPQRANIQRDAWLDALPSTPIRMNLSDGFEKRFQESKPSIKNAGKRTSVSNKPAIRSKENPPPLPNSVAKSKEEKAGNPIKDRDNDPGFVPRRDMDPEKRLGHTPWEKEGGPSLIDTRHSGSALDLPQQHKAPPGFDSKRSFLLPQGTRQREVWEDGPRDSVQGHSERSITASTVIEQPTRSFKSLFTDGFNKKTSRPESGSSDSKQPFQFTQRAATLPRLGQASTSQQSPRKTRSSGSGLHSLFSQEGKVSSRQALDISSTAAEQSPEALKANVKARRLLGIGARDQEIRHDEFTIAHPAFETVMNKLRNLK